MRGFSCLLYVLCTVYDKFRLRNKNFSDDNSVKHLGKIRPSRQRDKRRNDIVASYLT